MLRFNVSYIELFKTKEFSELYITVEKLNFE